MAITTEILATYRQPRKVIARLLAAGPREDRLVALAMGSCAIMFIAQMPKLARIAHINDQELSSLMGGSLMALMFILPLLLYSLAFVFHLLARAFGGQGHGYRARIALFWAMMASTPLMLLHGLVAGFIGAGTALNLVGALWLAAVLWFLMTGLKVCYWSNKS
ncbi:YIP1 family protein [Epibacterium sp. SM1969]|uniref:YIP1 family protein n=1 Tax=Tritonibacter aquimaris TaxID=2663379 RepID=A0A844APS8_9RHOB|nr:YIP1 family protein [Tritonibacter aquimaris]MQY41487.1 YIP1 family protein [Tritonibacter aquimaris]